METRMNRSILTFVVFVAASAALGAQQASPPGPYQGTSNPPPDEMITTPAEPKPAAGQPMAMQPATPDSTALRSQPQGTTIAGNDGDIVQVAPSAPGEPELTARSRSAALASDSDGDIVQVQALPPGVLGEGTTVRVRLLDRLSTTSSEPGQIFRTRVASDVVQGGQVLIPVGAEIDGSVVQVSSGHFAGHGSLRLRPETVILADGSRFGLRAAVFAAPGSGTHVKGEGTILPDSRLKHDGIEYGAGAGAGLVAGALIGGPVGALTGTVIGAGAVTVHLLTSHPQATLNPGTTLMFTLTDNVSLVPAAPAGN